MKNAEVFNDYDMVVCMTQKTINDQLTHLTKMGIIRSELILVQKVDRKTRSYVYQVLDCPTSCRPTATPPTSTASSRRRSASPTAERASPSC